MSDRFFEGAAGGAKRSAPAALRNREPIAEVLRDWLANSGTVLEIASGSGEHVVHFARWFPALQWQPSDVDPTALQSIDAWRRESDLPNILPAKLLDTRDRQWGVDRADAILSANMVHISPWESALGLLDGAARLLPANGRLILYGPWFVDDIAAAPSNLAFDSDLKRRDQRWGLRRVEDFAAAAQSRGFALAERRTMPANNLMLLFVRQDPAKA